jgi:transposase
VKLPHVDRKLLDLLMETHCHLDKMIKRSDSLVAELFRKMEEAQLISSIPGFGPFFSVLVATEIGNINRFPEAKKLHAYAGVIPSTHSSGGKTHHGKIIKAGNKWLRWAAVEAVWPAMRADLEIKLYYQKRMRPKGANVAKVATARKLLSIVYRVLKEKRRYEPYRRKSPVAFNRV